MLITKEVEVKLNSRNKKYFENLGYDLDQFKRKNKKRWSIPKDTKILVKIEQLPLGSHEIIEYECDYCHNTFSRSYYDYNTYRKKSIIQKDACKECMNLKREEGVLLKYHVKHTLSLPEVIEKRNKTNLDKYGAKVAFQNETVKEKQKQTIQEKYGCDNVFQNEDVKQKIKLTLLDKYNVENIMYLEETKEKIKQTNLERYQVEYHINSEHQKQQSLLKYNTEYPIQSDIVQQKQKESFYKNGTAPSSHQQRYLWQVIGGELNYPVVRSWLDIAFPDEMLYLEYDGGGHDYPIKIGKMTEKEFKQKEIRRSYALKKNGWNEVRIISIQDFLPSDKKLLEMIEFARHYISMGHSWIKFDIDNNKIINSQGEFDYDYGELRKITDKDFGEVV